MRKISLILVLLFSALVSSQEAEPKELHEKPNRLTFGGRYLAFLIYSEESLLEPDNSFDFNDSSKLLGFNFSVNYNIINGISIGVGSGVERFTQPRFSYVPLYTRIALNEGIRKSSFHTELIIGGHFTNDSKSGGLHRFLFGYRFRIHKTVFGDVSMIYTYQNLYHNFYNSLRRDNYYNFESVGLSLGIDLN